MKKKAGRRAAGGVGVERRITRFRLLAIRAGSAGTLIR